MELYYKNTWHMAVIEVINKMIQNIENFKHDPQLCNVRGDMQIHASQLSTK